MYWRIGGAYRDRPKEENRAELRSVVLRGPPPGLLAFDGDLAVGWCQVTPRRALPYLDGFTRFGPLDARPVWSVSCFFVRRGYRGSGVCSALLAAAIRFAREAGAPALEAYPSTKDPGGTPASRPRSRARASGRSGAETRIGPSCGGSFDPGQCGQRAGA